MKHYDVDEIEIMNRFTLISENQHSMINEESPKFTEWNDIFQLADVILGMAELRLKNII